MARAAVRGDASQCQSAGRLFRRTDLASCRGRSRGRDLNTARRLYRLLLVPAGVRIERPEFLAGVRTPILLGSAGNDWLVDPEAHNRAARPLPDCTHVELPGSEHEPFLERDEIRDTWFDAIDRFVIARLANQAG